jgi:uncharacterized repeat protein (TIGR02543 family)
MVGLFSISCEFFYNERPEQKNVKITGLSKYSGEYGMFVIGNKITGVTLAITEVMNIKSDGSFTSTLWDYSDTNEPWTGSGNYLAMLMIGNYSGTVFYYYTTIPSVSIINKTTIIPFNRTVSFNSNGGSEVSSITDVLYGEKMIEPANPIKNEHIFKGWYKDESLETIWDFSVDTIVANIILYAKWNELIKYSAEFNSNGGNAIDSITEIISGEKITKPTDPTRDGYLFEGWYKDEQLFTLWNFDMDTVTSNLTIYAKWRLIENIPPSNVSNINQNFDLYHNIIIYWTEPLDEDFNYVKIYEDGIFKENIKKGNNSFTISSYDVVSIKIQTADDLDNTSEGITYSLKTKETGVTRIIIKDMNNSPVSGAMILGFATNKTTISAISDATGAVFFSYSDNQAVTILIAHPSYAGLINNINNSQNYTFNFTDTTKGSILASSGTCYIPGLSGRLNPIKDFINRLYLYASNIAINGGLQQPVNFDLVNSLSLEDANGVIKTIWIPFMDGNTALINYSPK